MDVSSLALGTRAGWRPRTDLSLDQIHSGAALAVDAIVIILTSLTVGVVFHRLTRDQTGDILAFIATGAIVATLFCATIRIRGHHNRRPDTTGLRRINTALVVWTLVFLFLIAIAFSLKISAQFSRGTIFFFYLTGLATVSVSRWAAPQILAQWAVTNAYRGQEIMIVSPRADRGTQLLRNTLERQGCRNLRLISYNDCGDDPGSWVIERKRLLAAIFHAAHNAAPGEIYVLGGKLSHSTRESLLHALSIIPRAIYFVPEPHVADLLRHEVKPVGAIVTVEMQKAPLNAIQRLLKRALDFTAAACGILALSPFLAVVAVAIKLDSKGPVFFRQTRHGYRGTPFKIMKFRSMSVMEDGNTVTQATKNDRRVTRVGAFLRKSSVDELPQLWNVLTGDMSIVGPRPHAVAHDRMFSQMIENYDVRQHVKPGITGWAQVNGLRGETPNVDLMYRRIEMDIWYATNCSLLLDIQILVRTVIEVLRQRNAY